MTEGMIEEERATECPNQPAFPLRIMPRLDIKGPNVIKGVHLEGLKLVGKPAEIARRYYRDGADEIVYMDVVASLYGRNNILAVVEEAAREVFVPMTVGGGIRTIDDIVAALRSGADKVAINTAAIARPNFLKEAAEAFGSQCVVLSVEAKARGSGKWEALTDNGRETTGIDVLDWVVEAEALGVGEILVTSVDMEGTQKGFDIDLLSAVRERISLPVIACGGAGNAMDVCALLNRSGCDAACCASIFHYGICPIPDLKRALHQQGLTVRQ
jgi:cyclase